MTARPPTMSPYSVQYPTATSLLLPVESTSAPNLFDNDICTIARLRDWIFSSVASSGKPAKTGASVLRQASYISLMESNSKRMPRIFSSLRASSIKPLEEDGPGIQIPLSFTGPKVVLEVGDG